MICQLILSSGDVPSHAWARLRGSGCFDKEVSNDLQTREQPEGRPWVRDNRSGRSVKWRVISLFAKTEERGSGSGSKPVAILSQGDPLHDSTAKKKAENSLSGCFKA